jgi:hypothetical protein
MTRSELLQVSSAVLIAALIDPNAREHLDLKVVIRLARELIDAVDDEWEAIVKP